MLPISAPKLHTSSIMHQHLPVFIHPDLLSPVAEALDDEGLDGGRASETHCQFRLDLGSPDPAMILKDPLFLGLGASLLC